MRALTMTMAALALGAAAAQGPAQGSERYDAWPVLKSTFPSTGGGGYTIKGYDPVIAGGKCITTFMAVSSDTPPEVYANVAEFDAVPAQGGTLCTNGKWKAFGDGGSGTTPFKFFFKDGVFRAAPVEAAK
ncbi:MAG: hypothetical protein FJX62_18055 [Alphaproteobacteria bacterium]|nr:hypothetical protein [Alphaproteobacteria bacterium]